MTPLALISWPKAGDRWALVPQAEWPDRLPCVECDGDGGSLEYSPTAHAVEYHYDRDEWVDCLTCDGTGWRDVSALDVDYPEWEAAGFRWDEDRLYRRMGK